MYPFSLFVYMRGNKRKMENNLLDTYDSSKSQVKKKKKKKNEAHKLNIKTVYFS